MLASEACWANWETGVKKEDAKPEIISLMHRWKREEHNDTPASQLHSSDFISWLRQHFSGHLRFRTTTSVEYDIDMWFQDEFVIPGR